MTDTVTAERRSVIMGRVRGKDTTPELTVRRMIYAAGYRYRLHVAMLPGKPDLVFLGRRKIIFVHGCFWHRHANCSLARTPKTRVDFWSEKLDGNHSRDVKNQTALRDLGWEVFTVWECELSDRAGIMRRIIEFLEGRGIEGRTPATSLTHRTGASTTLAR